MKFVYEEDQKIPFAVQYPEDFEAWVAESISTMIIYDRWKRVAHCKRCGHTWHYDNVIYKGDITGCPNCAEMKNCSPHTCKPVGVYEHYFWMWNDGPEEIKFAVAEAQWAYLGQAVEKIEDVISICVTEIGTISRAEQVAIRKKWYYGWQKTAKVYIDAPWVRSRPGKTQAVIDASFLRHTGVEAGRSEDYLVRRLALHAKYPQAEYVAKAGLEEAIDSKIFGYPTHLYPNWKAQTIHKFLRITPQDVDKLRQWGCFNVDSIALYKYIKKYNGSPKKHHLDAMKRFFMGGDVAYIKNRYKREDDVLRIALYLEKKLPQFPTNFYCENLYKDYLKMLRDLDYPENDYYLYPKNLVAAHDRVAAEYREAKERARAKLEEAARVRQAEAEKKFCDTILPELQKVAYADGEYLIRPLESWEEFQKEGRDNVNCVLSYFDRAMRGEMYIFVMRKVAAPEESFITIEVDKDLSALRQCRTGGNGVPPEDAMAWAENWMKKVKQRKRRKSA